MADGATVPSGQIFAGSPAHYLRDLTQQEKHLIGEHHLEMQQLANVYHDMTELTPREQLEQNDEILRYMFQDPQERMKEELLEMGMPITHEDMEYIEHRVYHDYVGSVEYGIKEANIMEGGLAKSWQPYEQDLSAYPEVFKKYQENYQKYDDVKERFENEDLMQEQGDGMFVRRTPKNMSPWETKFDTLLPRYKGTSSQ